MVKSSITTASDAGSLVGPWNWHYKKASRFVAYGSRFLRVRRSIETEAILKEKKQKDIHDIKAFNHH